MRVPEEESFRLLVDSVTKGLENGQRGSRFPVLHMYFGMKIEDMNLGMNLTSVRILRRELEQIRGKLPKLQTGVYRRTSGVAVFTPVSHVVSENYTSPYITFVGKMIYPAGNALRILVDRTMNLCNRAIRQNRGFGGY